VVPVFGGNYHVFVQNPVSLFKPGWNEELIRWVFCSSTTAFCGPSAVSYTLLKDLQSGNRTEYPS
jgi:hypothetical protein